MGRPPIGKTAMTGAERVRRFRVKHGTHRPVTKHKTKPVTKPAGPDHATSVTRIERHIWQRQAAQQVANLLTRKSWTEDDLGEIADSLRSILNTRSIATLRRKLKPISDAENEAETRRNEERSRELWLREHPGSTAADFDRLPNDEWWDWRRAKNRASTAAEKRAWKRDHPGKQWPEHLCGLSYREYTAYKRWQRQRQYERRGGRELG